MQNREAPREDIHSILENVRLVDVSSREGLGNAVQWLQYAIDSGAVNQCTAEQLAELRAVADNIVMGGQELMNSMPHGEHSGVEDNSNFIDVQSSVETAVGMSNQWGERARAEKEQSASEEGGANGGANTPEAAPQEVVNELDWAQEMVAQILDEIKDGRTDYMTRKFTEGSGGKEALRDKWKKIAESGSTNEHRALEALVDEVDRQILIREVKGDIRQQPPTPVQGPPRRIAQQPERGQAAGAQSAQQQGSPKKWYQFWK